MAVRAELHRLRRPEGGERDPLPALLDRERPARGPALLEVPHLPRVPRPDGAPVTTLPVMRGRGEARPAAFDARRRPDEPPLAEAQVRGPERRLVNEPLPELLDAKAVQAELRVTRAAAERIMRQLPTVEFEDLRKVYVRRDDLRALIEKRTFQKDQVVH